MSNPALNAAKHGLLSECPVIDGFETEEGWLAHRQAFWDDLQPRGAVEAALVERIALTFWRMARLARAEVAAAQRARDHRLKRVLSLQDPDTEVVYTLEEAHAEFQRRERVCDWYAAFDRHPASDPLPPDLEESLCEWLLFAADTVADDLDVDHLDAAALLNRCRLELQPSAEPVPSSVLPAGMEAAPTTPLTVGDLRLLFQHVALAMGCSPNLLVRAIRAEASDEASSLRRKLREAEAAVAEIHRTSQLPDVKDLQLFTRYDAHLGRELSRLFRTLKDLRSAAPFSAAGESPEPSAVPVPLAPPVPIPAASPASTAAPPSESVVASAIAPPCPSDPPVRARIPGPREVSIQPYTRRPLVEHCWQ